MAGISQIQKAGVTYDIYSRSVAPKFSTAEDYKTGERCYYNGTLYRFIQDHDAGAWNSSDVEATTVGDEIDNLNGALNERYTRPYVYDDVEYTEEVGIYNRNDLTIFKSGDSYSGRCTKISVEAGEVYIISGYSTNNNYPCAFGTTTGATTAYIPLFLSGYSTTYTNATVTIPNGVTLLYVNGLTTSPISIKKRRLITNQEVTDLLFESDYKMYAKYDDGILYFKKKSIQNGKDIVVKMGKSPIGNNLFTFLYVYYINNTGTLTDDFVNDYTATLDASQTDWFSPYRVKAVNAHSGASHPTDVYFTGGNHRSNNGSTGGGKTATSGTVTVYIDGILPTDGVTYGCFAVDVYFSNDVNGYNTSKDDGTGDNILTEKFHLHITTDRITVEHIIIPLEEILIERYYGLSVYYPSSTVRLIGGNTRSPFTVSDDVSSGNKTTRDVVVNGTFEIKSGICATDLGDFGYCDGSSYFTSGNKIYSNLIWDNTTEFAEDDEFVFVGYYEFN